MGCALCNLTRCKRFEQGDKTTVENCFYCKTRGEEKQFLNDLAYDIASRHPEMVRKINEYAAKLDEKVVVERGVCRVCRKLCYSTH